AHARRRLRHRRLPFGPPRLRDAPRLQGLRPRGAPPRPAGGHRARCQPHQRTAPLVRGVTLERGWRQEGLVRLVRYRSALQGRAGMDERHPGRMLLAEANQWPSDVRPYFGDGDECHMAFHFPAMPRIWIALRKEDSWPIIDIMEQTPAIPENCQWALFLRNHDELTLEMVTDDERDYMWNEYAIDPRSRINLGIRRRL